MELNWERQLSSFELTCLEWLYVKSVLAMWQKEAFQKAFDYLKRPVHPSDIHIILKQLKSISSFHDVETELPKQGSELQIWCDGGCPYFKLIAQQEELFKHAPRFAILVPCYFNNFKIPCIKEIFFRCWQDVVEDKTNGEEHRKVISTLNVFLAKAIENQKLQDIMEENISEEMLTRDKANDDWPQWFSTFCEKIQESFQPDSNEESSIPDWFKNFKEAAKEIGKDKWTLRFTSIIKEVFKLYLLPKTTVDVKRDNGRQIIFVYGNVVFLSKVIDKMKDLRRSDVQEIRIVGLASVHVDCDLNNDIWHGINVGLDTDKIIVDGEVSWNLSGQHIVQQNAGEPRQPGESGGNVHIICNEMINAKQWTIVSDGGDGSAAHKWSKEEFNEAFPSMSIFETGVSNKETIATTLQNILPDSALKKFKEEDNFCIRGPMADFNDIMISLFSSPNDRHSLIFFQGRGVGQGGYGGTVTLEILNGSPSTKPSLPFIGIQKRLPFATSMAGVYEACGSEGKIGKPAGDIGFIHTVNNQNHDTNREGEYFGFGNDVKLELSFPTKKSEGVNSCVKLKSTGEEVIGKFASIVNKEDVPKPDPARLVEAAKKKAILRQSLFQHHSQISQHKDISKSLQEMFSSPPQRHPTSFDPNYLAKFTEIQRKNNELQLRQLTFQNQQNPVEIARAKMVKQASLKQSKANSSSCLRADHHEVATEMGCAPKTTINSEINPNEKPDEVERSVEDVVNLMTQNEKMSENQKFLDSLKEIIINSKTASLGNNLSFKKIKKEWTNNGLDLGSDKALECFLDVYSDAVEKELRFSLRDAQRVAIVALLRKCQICNTLVQVSTGEGKSLIVAAVAIALALSKKKKSKQLSIDVITSNNVLALRDTSLPSNKGGLKNLYAYFGVSVANNCGHSKEERIKAYESAVVYGELASFQRDYLLDKFYGHNARGNREFKHVIIDEVDCMLLDRSSNTLYLSHDIPGMETLESLYVFIWEKIQNSTVDQNNSKEQVKKSIESDILFDLYGVTTKENLELVHALLDDSEKEKLWSHLIKKEVIDSQGRLLITDASQITKEKVNCSVIDLQRKDLNDKLVFYFRKVANRHRRIRIPSHLLEFVDRNLKTWLNSAFQALDLRRDEDYVIDQDRTDTSPDLNPQVIIIDPDTGTDQTLSQWDGALHQFLQLKEGCKLTLQSLKAVFISNATYILKYDKMVGVSGTLGSEQEKKFLSDKYKCNLFSVPTAFPKNFTVKPAKVLRSEAKWLEEIINETRNVLRIPEEIQDQPQRDLKHADVKPRSIVIFCRTIRDVNKVYNELKTLCCPTYPIHRYTRDYEKFAFESSKLGIGHVIVATNLAGRGTDIKIGDDLKVNGGLHICLTYLPENERIKEQAMGRAGRKGDPGSGILILCEIETWNKDEELGDEQLFNNMERLRNEQESQRLSRLEEDFEKNKIQEIFFRDFIGEFSVQNIKDKFGKGKKMGKTEKEDDVEYQDNKVTVQAIRDSALDKWALWLDANELNYSNVNFPDKLPDLKDFDNIMDWIMPARSITVAKDLVTCEKPNLSKADQFLERIVNSENSFFYPAAHYYQIFISLKQEKFKNKKDEFFRNLRATETIINQHIDMQLSFNSVMNQPKIKPAQIPSFCAVDVYKEQKKNNVNILEHFLDSIVFLLGNYCSIASLREASKAPDEQLGIQERSSTEQMPTDHTIRREKVGKYYKYLVETKCIACELNDPNTIPSQTSFANQKNVDDSSRRNRRAIIQRIADDYAIEASLEKTLVDVFDKALSEEEIEKELEKHIFIPSSRKAFWKKLVEAGVLKIPKIGIEMECVIMSDSQCNGIPELDRDEAITLDFGYDTYDREQNCLTVLYNPIYDNKGQLDDSKKLMFPKKYVKRIMNYELEKQNFEFNKIARLDLDELEKIELREFGRLLDDDFHRANIVPAEREGIWEELIKQNMIDDQGFLAPGCDLTKGFDYPQGPVYSDAVMHLIEQKFVVEIVRRRWLKIKDLETMSEENSDYLKAINLLPLKPHRDMLGDLMAAQVVSGARVTYDMESKLKDVISKIKDADEGEQKALLKFFKDRRPFYARSKKEKEKQEFALDPLTIRMIPSAVNVLSELLVFRLMGLDSVIRIQDRKWSFKRKSLALLFSSLIVAGGITSISAGVLLLICCPELPFQLYQNVLFKGGFSDITYAITTVLSHKDFTWNEYWRQRISSATGKVCPIDTINSLRKSSANRKKHIDHRDEPKNAQRRTAGGEIVEKELHACLY
ncbi:uncharacterized protein LOC116930725 [Daphnia magna]|uniref:uncharacterized protein LOC116930725 n=1 Tax=Daphnia magna TaxID=35525 RepID=UPI001E1BAE2F|nr:uncharacterized protein LOC116930725 [Daphnia magna]